MILLNIYFSGMKNKNLLLSIFIFGSLLSNGVFAQYSFQRLIGGVSQERGQTLFQTLDGGYLYNAATLSYGSGSADGFFVKTNNQGLLEWARAYGTSFFDNSEYAIQAYDGKLLGTGLTYFPGNTTRDVLLFKTDSMGQLIWSKTYGGGSNDGAVHMIETSDHGYALVGTTQSIGAGSDDILFIRTDENGDTLFTRSYGSSESEVGISIAEVPSGGFVICGKQTRIVGGFSLADGILLRTDASGDLLWTNLYGDSLWEELESVAVNPDESIVSCGAITTYGAGKYDVLCLKTNSTGDVDWAKAYGGAEVDASYGILINSDSSYTISGYTNSLGYGHENRGDDSTNIFLMKINAFGDTIWTRSYGDGLQDEAFRNSSTADGGYLVSGFTTNYAFQDSAQMIMIKTDSLGFTGCHESTSHPVVTNAPLVSRSTTFLQSSGLLTGTISLVEMLVNTDNEDACLYTFSDESKSKSGFQVYPNPVSSLLFIQSTFLQEIDKVSISDIQGRILDCKDVNRETQFSLDFTNYAPGIYFLSIFSTDADEVVCKFVKN